MSEPVFYFRDGDLWHRGAWWSREDMERQARHFEAKPAKGLYARFNREMAAECRAALIAYDRYHERVSA